MVFLAVSDVEVMIKLLADVADPTVAMPLDQRETKLLEGLGQVIAAETCGFGFIRSIIRSGVVMSSHLVVQTSFTRIYLRLMKPASNVGAKFMDQPGQPAYSIILLSEISACGSLRSRCVPTNTSPTVYNKRLKVR